MSMEQEAEIERLRLDRDYWKAEAQKNAEAEQIGEIAKLFAISPQEAWIVGKLYAAHGKVVRRERLAYDMPGKRWDERADEYNICNVLISRLRDKMGINAIETVRGVGYRLSAKVAGEIDAVVCR